MSKRTGKSKELRQHITQLEGQVAYLKNALRQYKDELKEQVATIVPLPADIKKKPDHECRAPGCGVQVFDPEEDFCQYHEANRKFGVE